MELVLAMLACTVALGLTASRLGPRVYVALFVFACVADAVAAHHLGSVTDYRVDSRRQARRTLLAALLLALLLSLIAVALLLKFPPGWIWLALCLGVASVLGLTLLIEQYDFAWFRPITRLVPLFDNASAITGVHGFEASPLEILLIGVTAGVCIRAASRPDQLRKNPLTVPVVAFVVAPGASLVLGLYGAARSQQPSGSSGVSRTSVC